MLVLLAACGSWQRVGTSESQPGPAGRGAALQLPQLTDPMAAYRAMGLITDAGPIGFVGTVRLLAGPSPDTMLAALALSLRNRGLTWHRDGNTFVAEYHVEIQLRQGTTIAQQVARDERVRVATFRETQRIDESVIFQQTLRVPAGQYLLALIVRDRSGPNAGHAETPLDVPQRRLPAVSMPVAVYEARPRTAYAEPPSFVVNARSSVGYGLDSLRFYVETYGLPAGAPLVVNVLDAGERVAWSDTIPVATGNEVQALILSISPAQLSLGRYELRMVLNGELLAAAPFLVVLSDQWIVGNFTDMVSLLRYFPQADTLRAVLNAPPEQRAAAWQKFWHDSDPNPASPENEALDEYFARLQQANERFRDEGTPGWLTDRGEVLVTLGEPDDILDRRPDLQGRGRVLTWTYNEYRLTLYFVDDNGFGRFRLDPRSRSEFLRVMNRVRRMS